MDQPGPTNQEPVVLQGTKINSKEIKRYKTLSMVLGILLVLSLVGAGVLGYRYMSELVETSYLKHDKAELNKQVASLEERMLDSGGKNGPSDSQVTLTDREQAESAASRYYCNIKDFGCDKVVGTITKFQAPSATGGGFAIVKAGGAEGATNFYVKSADGASWVVIYDGQNTPPQEIIDKFGIPAEFAQ